MRGYHIEIALSDSSVPLPTEIFSDLSAYKPQPGPSRSNSTPPKDYRFGPIRVDWMDLPETLHTATTKKVDSVPDPTTNGKQPMPPSKFLITCLSSDPYNSCFSGLSTSPLSATFIPSPRAGPSTTPLSFGTANLSEGTIRLFRDIYRHEEDVGPRMPQDDGTMLSVLAVPSYMTPADFITYVAPAEDGMAHLRLIR
jgi:BRCA1-associated protein